jgi:ArsR family transcriptional regulator
MENLKTTMVQEKILLDNRKITKQAELFAALADPTRLKLLQVLCLQNPPGCRCVNNLSHLLGISQPAVSQHLRVLKSVGLVIGERRGFRMHYLIDPEGLKHCQGILSTTLEFDENCEENSRMLDCYCVKPTT